MRPLAYISILTIYRFTLYMALTLFFFFFANKSRRKTQRNAEFEKKKKSNGNYYVFLLWFNVQPHPVMNHSEIYFSSDLLIPLECSVGSGLGARGSGLDTNHRMMTLQACTMFRIVYHWWKIRGFLVGFFFS